MAYQKKYFYTFVKLKTTEVHTVEIWQNTEDVLVAEEIQGHMNPFTVEMPEIDHKFQVCRGTGCVLNLLSDTDMKFFTSLYHVNPTDFMVKHYIASTLNGLYYLNAEMISEPYDINFNYQVSLTGNDGFSLMDRFSFLQSDGTNYTGIKSKFELIQIIFGKIGLPFDKIKIALSTTFTGQTANPLSNLLVESYVNCENFYDEDKKPMSLREVIESILSPYGAYIRAEHGSVFINDIHTLAQGGSITYQLYPVTGSGVVTTQVIANEKTIAAIGYKGTGTQIEMSGGVNRQVVTYSPYPLKVILEESVIDLDEFSGIPATFSTKDGYNYKTLTGNKYFDTTLGTFEASYFTSEDDTNIYLRWQRFTLVNTKVASLIVNPYVNISGAKVSVNQVSHGGVVLQRTRNRYVEGAAILITGDILTKTKSNPYNEAIIGKPINSIGFTYKMKVGNRSFDMTTRSWIVGDAYSMVYTTDLARGVIADMFVPIGLLGNGLLIPVGNLSEDIMLNGNFEFEIWSEFKTTRNDNVNLITNSSDVQEVWIKNLSINIVHLDGTELSDTDTDYIGLLDKTFQNEGEKIILTCGTDQQYSDRGKIIKYDGTNYSDITAWTRNAQTFKIEELLLASLSSNYRSGFITLSNVKLNTAFSLQNIITDTFIGTKKLMVKSANINYHDDIVECTLVEITPDELIIVKDPTIY